MIEFKIPAKIRVKADLMIKIRDVVEERGMTQKQVASLANVTQPRISDLLKGKVDLFSTDSLLDIAESLDVQMVVVFYKV